jgi:hypothetical protein
MTPAIESETATRPGRCVGAKCNARRMFAASANSLGGHAGLPNAQTAPATLLALGAGIGLGDEYEQVIAVDKRLTHQACVIQQSFPFFVDRQ